MIHKTEKKQNKNTIYGGHHYAQSYTNNVSKTMKPTTNN